MENINIETELFPEAGKLSFCQESQTFRSVLFDAELDPLECTFLSDETVLIITTGLEYVQLDEDTLYKLLGLLLNASSQFENADYDYEQEKFLIA
jgi:hypothetical protein